MKIIVVSDTHMPKRAKSLPKKLTEALKTADLIIHAGDWQTIDVYNELSSFAPVEGVYGNVDGEDVKSRFEQKKVLDINGYRIGIVHGHGQKGSTEKRALSAFSEEMVDVIVYGHSHIPIKKMVGDLLLFNPGSATDKRRQKKFSFGMITINGELHAEHIYYEDKQ
ncbi:metallophosphoesterase family protein [Peribacillus sp. SCS-155]|uniref:metallophosphoesterase family protein n=1 Tax=Peribacillus sedimenti TaxID=3115297 RepID=UPI0039067B49